MKYFVVTSTIRDGEYEYLQQSPVEATSEIQASKVVEKDNLDWISDDYREQEINSVSEVTKQEFDVLKKYIY